MNLINTLVQSSALSMSSCVIDVSSLQKSERVVSCLGFTNSLNSSSISLSEFIHTAPISIISLGIFLPSFSGFGPFQHVASRSTIIYFIFLYLKVML
jgi:hypothetical protein